jgi:glycerophosphoryl diester phosphodiesterase
MKKAFHYSLAVICLLAACHVSKKVQESTMLPVFDKEGHRGCRGLMPENTIPAMLKAVDLGVTTLEMDASFTKDRQIILSHEPFFNHEITTKPDGSFIYEKEERKYNMYQMTYDEVKKYDVGLKPHPRFPQQQKLTVHKPLLGDVIDSVEAYCRLKSVAKPFYNIETKTQPATDNVYHPGPEEFVDLLMTLINKKGIAQRVIIQSFDFRTLRYLHIHYPKMKTAMLIEDFDKRSLDEELKDLGFIPAIYSPAFELLNRDVIKQCHRQHMKVIPWTVDDKTTIDKLKQMGVDGIITDFPDLFNE